SCAKQGCRPTEQKMVREPMTRRRLSQLCLAPPFQKILEELPLFFKIARRWRVCFFRSVFRSIAWNGSVRRIRRAHRRGFGRGGGVGLLASSLPLCCLAFKHQLPRILGHQT